MSILIDDLIDCQTIEEIDGRWYIAKPYFRVGLFWRVWNMFQVLFGKSIAIHFKRDRVKP